MRKSVAFEAIVTILLLLLIFVMYVMIAGNAPRAVNGWNVTIGTQAPYLYAGDNGTLYVFSGNNVSMIGVDGAVKWNMAIPDNWTMVNEWDLYLENYDQYPTEIFSSQISRNGRNLINGNSGFRPGSSPAIASHDGVLYVYIRPNIYFGTNDFQENITSGLDRALGRGWDKTSSYVRLMAIASNGSILWDQPLDNGTDKNIESWLPIEDVYITASSDRIYVYHPYSITALDSSGTFLFRLDNVSDPAAVDERGNIFTAKATTSAWGTEKVPSGTIDAYYPNGTLWWQKDMPEPLQRQILADNVKPVYWTLPIYQNGTLYLPLKKSVVAMDPSGSILWSIGSKWDMDLLGVMPLDSQNNVYLTIDTKPTPGSDWVYYQGTMVTPSGIYRNFSIQQYNGSLAGADNGLGYFVYLNNWFDRSTGYLKEPSRLNDLISLRIQASDFKTGQDLWEFTIPTSNFIEMRLNPSNVNILDELSSLHSFYGGYTNTGNATGTYNREHPELQNLSRSAMGPWQVVGAGDISVLPGDNTVYVSYYMFNYEYPTSLPHINDYMLPASTQMAGPGSGTELNMPVFNRSDLVYVSGVLALDDKGHMLWNRPTDSLVTAMAVNNSTVYYTTKDGKLFATQAGIALGFALLAIVYLFLRFVCVGAVARARNRTNENRTVALQYVVDNPGSTLRDISRGLHMNLGTARYHMFILALNHRVVVYQADGKHVRYFMNSGTYSKEEQMIMSFMRRDGMRKILRTLLNRPGLSNLELSSEIGLQESAVSRYMKELAEKGIVVKELASIGTSAYFLASEKRDNVAKAMEIMKGE